MLALYLVLAAAIGDTPSVSNGQDAPSSDVVEQAVSPGPPPPSGPPGHDAVPRPEAPAVEAPLNDALPPTVDVRATEAAPVESAGEAADQRRAVRRGSRPQGDNPRTGTAVPREGRREAPPPESRRRSVPDRGRTVIVRPPAVYNNYYRNPYRYYPYGYGAFGLGYFYYDPYRWYPGAYAYSPYAGSGYVGQPFTSFDVGELRLQVSPRHAQVYVDGYYAGTVDEFDGAFQSLKLEAGPYLIEIVAPGFDTLEFRVRINPGQKTTYRGDLIRRP